MVFSSWQFAFFFLAVFAIYWSLPTRRSRHLLLLAASYLFYMAWNARLVTIVMGLTLFDYSVGILLERAAGDRRRKLLLVASLTANLAVLAIFKYADFFILSLRDLLASMGLHTGWQTLGIILPVGISFHTFQTMSYTIDVYRRKIPACRSLIDFALFVAFFPQLVAGPIVKAVDFLPQLNAMKRFNWPRMDAAIVLFLIGLTKKLLIADSLGALIDPIFADPTRFARRDLWLGMLCYGGQIYCDFSGYTDMAIACARMLGFELCENFANPYLALGLSDFWRRWHISLSSWFRDYLYIPLGGSRHGPWRTYRNLLLTMLLAGLWHGASWTFVVWGAIHGAALAVSKALPRASDLLPRSIRTIGVWACTFLVVHIAWIFFRCQPMPVPGQAEFESASAALSRACYYAEHLFISPTPSNPVWLMNKPLMAALFLLMMGMQVYDEWRRSGRPALRLPAPLAGVGYASWIAALVVLSPENTSPFIYFQF
ncbi:MAG TPA: MBOAT family O-acyltransferase [Phycisphaerae bacterium]|nr:MBOAT family O-acyltransferase [Phycisphaerae bacterium]